MKCQTIRIEQPIGNLQCILRTLYNHALGDQCACDYEEFYSMNIGM